MVGLKKDETMNNSLEEEIEEIVDRQLQELGFIDLCTRWVLAGLGVCLNKLNAAQEHTTWEKQTCTWVSQFCFFHEMSGCFRSLNAIWATAGRLLMAGYYRRLGEDSKLPDQFSSVFVACRIFHQKDRLVRYLYLKSLHTIYQR